MLGTTLFVLFSTTIQLCTQGSLTDYQRADNLRNHFRDQIFQLEIKPNWSDDNQRFWYINRLSGGRHQFVVIESGRRKPAFNHHQLAQKLTSSTNQAVDPERLPINRLFFTDQPHLWRFHAHHSWWEFDTKTEDLKSVRFDALPTLLEPVIRPTRQTGEETFVTFSNQSDQPIQLFWLDWQGDRKHYATLSVDENYQQHTFSGHVWLITDEKGRPFGIYEASFKQPVVVIESNLLSDEIVPNETSKADQPSDGVWSPDSTQLAFVQDHNLWLWQRNGRRQQLTQDGHPDDGYDKNRIHWSPNNRKLIVFKVQPAEEHLVHLVESSPTDQIQPKLHSFQYLKPGDKIAQPHPYLFDVDTGKKVRIEADQFPNPWSLSHTRWRQDSTTFYFLYNQRGHQIFRLIAVEADSGQSTVVFSERSPTFIDYSQKMYLHWLNDDELVWMSERDGWNHLYLYNVVNRKLHHQITSGQWGIRQVEHIDTKKRQIWFQASGDGFIHDPHLPNTSDPYYIHYGRIDLSGKNLVWLTKGDGTHQVQWSPDRRFLIDSWSRVDLPFIHQLRSSVDGSLICDLERSDWTNLKVLGWSVPERFISLGRDKETKIYGLIWRPTNFDKDKKYPIIEHIYAGPHSAFVPKKFHIHYQQQAMAELGFIVVQIDGMGTNWRSKHFHDYCWQNLKDAGFPDRIAWIQSAGLQYPEMDLMRVGIYGGSAGGQNALSGILHHGDFYRVGVADCGCHDNRMDKIWWNEAWMGWPVGSHYTDNSNVTHAEKLRGKLLLVVGELDRNVDPSSTLQVVNALIQADKDFDLLIIPGAGHGAVGTDYGTRRQRDFFVRHLFGCEPRYDKIETN